jgi:hypothetical protein
MLLLHIRFLGKKLRLELLFYPEDREQSSPKIVVFYSLLLPLKQHTMYKVHEANDHI